MMVRALLDTLAGDPEFPVHHLDFRLSTDHTDIGRWRPGKILRTFAFAVRAVVARFRHGCDTLYYVPAPPGKRGALYRDWIVLALCRPFFRRLVLHWQAGGLALWLQTGVHPLERAISARLYGRATLAIVLAAGLRPDAELLRARTIAIVANGLADPGEPPPAAANEPPHQALFLALCSEEKGLFAAAEAVIAANARRGAPAATPAFTLVAAGPFPDARTEARFAALVAAHPRVLRYAGFAGPAEKRALFAASRCLLFPTRYPAETFSLVALEALAHDRPVVATRWRGLPEIVSPDCGRIVDVGNAAGLVDALVAVCTDPPPAGVCRARFLREFTIGRHADRLRAALRSIA